MPVELLDRPHQAEHALLHEVGQAEPLTLVALGDVHDEPEVGVDHVLAGCRVAGLDALSQLHLLAGGEQGIAPDLVEEQREGVLGRVGRRRRYAVEQVDLGLHVR